MARKFYPTLNASLGNFQRSSEQFRTAAEVLEYANFFAKGYVICHGDFEARGTESWASVSLGAGYTLHVSPETDYVLIGANEQQGDAAVLIIGHAFCSDIDTRSSESTAQYLYALLKRESDFTSFEKTLIDCSGRFVAIVLKDNELRAYTDPMASKSCFWGGTGNRIVLASHTALIADYLGDTDSSQTSWIMHHKGYVSPGGKSLPALITPHDCAKEVFANCYLSIVDDKVSHRRFFPNIPLTELSVDDALDRYVEECRFNVKSWLDQADYGYLALTAGQDSQSMLKCSLDLFQNSSCNITATTYHFFDRAIESTANDLIGANKVALKAGFPHQIVAVQQISSSQSAMAALYNTTFPTWARFPSLTASFYEQLAANSLLFWGLGGEIGTVFYQERSQEISPAVLAKKYAYSDVSSDPKLIKMFEEYIDYTQLGSDSWLNYDPYDLFYWEHRMTKWASAGYSEYDLSATVALPLNSRKIFRAMLSLGFEDRKNKTLYAELARRSF
ncbi:MAG: hypothetical protein MR006_03795 [Arcanobacterium sp.]|nr:hypothetical protein [Arcanobacterium sp.]MDY5588841.1 hypothetical protein [Arcanobacterium sp.]